MKQEAITRRNFLQLTALGAAGLALPSCAFINLSPQTQNTSIPEKMVPVKNEVGIFRGATIRLETSKEFGHGFLVKDENNELYIGTIGHVADAMKSDIKNATADILGIGKIPIKPSRFSSWEKKSNNEADTGSFYSIPAEDTVKLKEELRKQNILSIRLTKKQPSPGQRFHIPRRDSSSYTIYVYKSYDPLKNLYILEVLNNKEGEKLCKGDSGVPLLEPDTAISYGIFSNGLADTQCSSAAFVRPNY